MECEFKDYAMIVRKVESLGTRLYCVSVCSAVVSPPVIVNFTGDRGPDMSTLCNGEREGGRGGRGRGRGREKE